MSHIGVSIAAMIVTIAFMRHLYNRDELIVVRIPNGQLQGYIKNGIFAFESIPYAEPPIGNYRFEPPLPYTYKWNDVREATSLPEFCMQWSEFAPENERVIGVEDCLYLNVYTPNIINDVLYPVVVFIHGGAFMHGGSKLLDSYLAKKANFVYVTFNYRLGPLGFLSTEDEEIPGNMGLKDQRMALRWVKQNIKAFKGDPKRIILSGFSAGGASVHYHLLKKSERLFRVAVSHSGTAHCPWASISNPLERAKKLAAHLKCPTDDTSKMKSCLKGRDARHIVKAVEKFLVFHSNPFTVFGPVIEPKSSNDPFLTENISTIVKSGKSTKIPWLITYTVDEGVYNAAYLLQKDKNQKEIIDQLNHRWEQIAPLMLFFNESVPVDKHSEMANYYKTKYLGNEQISRANYWNVQKMCTDRYFLEGIQQSIELHRDYSGAPVYVYAFDHPAPINLGQKMSKKKNVFFGTGHGDDVFLIFVSTLVRSAETFTNIEQIITEKLTRLYAYFIKFGIPKYGYTNIPQNIPYSDKIKLLRIKGTEGIIEYTDQLY